MANSLNNGVLTARQEDLQGIMGPYEYPFDSLAQMPDPFQGLTPTAQGLSDSIPDLRLSPVENKQGPWYPDARLSLSYRDKFFSNETARNEAWSPLLATGLDPSSIPDATHKRRRINGSDDGTVQFSDVALSEHGGGSYVHEATPSESGYGTKSIATPSIISSSSYKHSALSVPFTRHKARRASPSRSRERASGPGSDITSVSGETTSFDCTYEGCRWTGKNSSDRRSVFCGTDLLIYEFLG
jgi:hypothetical protein